MQRIVYLIIVIIVITKITSDAKQQYGGEKFPIKYFSLEENNMTITDLDRYIKYLNIALGYFNSAPNDTEINTALSVFLTKSTLKKAVIQYAHKLKKYQIENIKKVIDMGENVLAHYMYENLPYYWDDFEYRVSRMLQLDDAQAYSVDDFNKNRLKKWIITKSYDVHKYLKEMDEATLPRDVYCKESTNFEDYNIDIAASDTCLSRVSANKEPIHFSQMQQCKVDKYCENRMYMNPSIAYSLSHRMLNMYLRHSIKRCYVKSEERDKLLLDQLCANMFRESVYLARRGFFARDLFLEHIGLCGLLGYEEFHRKNWFHKAISWITKDGCIVEDKKFIRNRTLLHLKLNKYEKDVRKRKKSIEYYCKSVHSECDDHPTAVLLMVLAHAIRYAAYKI